MRERGDGYGFALETLARRHVGAKVRWQDLDCDFAVQRQVTCRDTPRPCRRLQAEPRSGTDQGEYLIQGSLVPPSAPRRRSLT